MSRRLDDALAALDRDRIDSLDSGLTQIPKGTLNMVVDLIAAARDEAAQIDPERLALVYHRLYGDPCEYDGCAGGIVGREHAEALAAAYNAAVEAEGEQIAITYTSEPGSVRLLDPLQAKRFEITENPDGTITMRPRW